jgi:tRNA 2-selenouridine synthase SelU
MAKVQLSIEELINLIRGEVDLPELKSQLAKSLLDVWQRDETRNEIEAKGKELAKKKMERVIEDAFKLEKGSWNRPDRIVGWAVPIIREELNKATLSLILEAIKPELETVVSDMVHKAFGSMMIKMFKEQSNN